MSPVNDIGASVTGRGSFDAAIGATLAVGPAARHAGAWTGEETIKALTCADAEARESR